MKNYFSFRSSTAVRIVPALLLFAALSAAQPVPAVSVDQAVRDVERHYRDVTDLTAGVVQKNFLKTLGKTQTFEGALRILKPGRLRLEYANGQLILVNGRDALFYSKKSEQVIKKTFTDFQQMNIPVAFLLGAANIRDDFDVLQPDPENPRRLELVPKKSGAAMQKLVLDTEESGRISGITIHDRSGNVTEIAFSDVRENTGLKESAFRFNPPKGTEIIEQ